MRMLRRRGAGLFPALLLLAGCNPPAEIVRPDELRATVPGAVALVVVYSRSGHTAAVARRFAKALGADFLRIQGEGGEGDGFFSTPSWDTPVPVHPGRVDLRPYRLVLLGTPIWYWKPSALLVSFIDANDFTGKDVVLFYTNEGGIREGNVRKWRARVEARGGRVRDVVGVDRKDLGNETEIEAADRLVRERAAGWGP